MHETVVTENPAANQLIVSRDFSAPLELVWRAWSEPELLDKWFAPEPFKSVTKHMDFKEGGTRLYCMQGPNGEQHWGKMTYLKIVVHAYFDAEDMFCDEEGNPNEFIPPAQWHVVFTHTGSGTRVVGTTTFVSAEAMKQTIEMGVIEGIKMTYDNLAKMLAEVLKTNK